MLANKRYVSFFHIRAIFFSCSYNINTAPIAAPELLSVSISTSTSLTLTWNPPPFGDTNGVIQYYTVRLTELDTNTAFPPRNVNSGQTSFINLHPYYVYQCTVAAFTVGEGPYTLPITIQLAQEGKYR